MSYSMPPGSRAGEVVHAEPVEKPKPSLVEIVGSVFVPAPEEVDRVAEETD
jgi:hypothetical protein